MPEKTIEPFAAINAVPTLAKGEEAPEFKAVQDFLQRFGYLGDNGFHADELDDVTAEALARYQQQHGLTQSGVFDDRTREQMTTHRCGMPDLDPALAFSTRCAWPTPNLTFAFEDGTADIGGNAEFQAVRNAFATWAAAVPLTFTEVTAAQSPDIMIDWRPANDPDHSMVGGVLAHADFPPGCSVVTNTLPKPVHFDDSEHLWVIGSVANGFDVETIALHEIGHILGLQHSNVAGSVMFPTVSSNSTKRALTADDLAGIRSLYPASVLAPGTYTIRQKSSGRFVDAHEISSQDFRLVTRTAQNNDTQCWELASVGTVFEIRQKSSGRFMDAHDHAGEDFRLVTRTAQNNDTQRWELTSVGTVYAIQQRSSGRFVDAHDHSGQDFRLVTRSAEANDTQRWVVRPVGDGSVTMRQLSSGRFVDAHEHAGEDFRLVTRTAQNNDTQRWLMTNTGVDTFTIRQKSNGRFVDAHEHSGEDFRLVTRTAQSNDTQRWIFSPIGAVYTIRQKSNGRFVDAHEHSGEDFRLVTRPAQNNDTQRWVVLPVGDGSFTMRQLSGRRFVDAHDNAGEDFRLVTRTAQNDDSQRWLFERT